MILDDAANAKLLQRLRSFLLGILLLGTLALISELALVEHWGDQVQRVPLALLGLIAVTTLAVGFRPVPPVLAVFRLVMISAVLAGCAGALFHFRSNAIVERGLDSTLMGPALVESALSGAIPVLAPWALIQLGLLGIPAVYRHPGP